MMETNDWQIKSPNVFISCCHDSEEHCQRVLALSNRLRKEGINAIIGEIFSSGPYFLAHTQVSRGIYFYDYGNEPLRYFFRKKLSPYILRNFFRKKYRLLPCKFTRLLTFPPWCALFHLGFSLLCALLDFCHLWNFLGRCSHFFKFPHGGQNTCLHRANSIIVNLNRRI